FVVAPATTRVDTLSLHDALPISWADLPGCRACDLRDYCQRCFADARAEVGSPLLPYPMACRGARWHYEARHGAAPRIAGGSETRSEEHTSEFQSRENLVCRLLLE